MATEARPTVNSPGFDRLVTLGVPEIVQAIDELLVGERLARRSSSGRANTRGSTRSRSPCSRSSITRENDDVVVADGETQSDQHWHRHHRRRDARPTCDARRR